MRGFKNNKSIIMKTIIALLFMACCLQAQEFTAPSWSRYTTVDKDGTRVFWQLRPRRDARYKTWRRNRHETGWMCVKDVPPANWRKIERVNQ